jgi:hypothetical protein
MLRRAVLLALVLSVPAAHAQGGWSASPVITLERTRFPVAAATPGCEEAWEIERGAQRLADAVAVLAAPASRGETRAEAAERIAVRLGDVSARLGTPVVLQRHATCAVTCAPVPLDAHSVRAVRGFYASRPGEPFREVEVGTWGNYFRWDPEVDTTWVTDTARWVCLRARNWVAEFDREAFFLVRYER